MLNEAASGSIVTGYGLYVAAPITLGPITNLYGVYVQDSASLNYFAGHIQAPAIRMIADSINAFGLFRANGATQDFAYDSTNGRFGFGITTPTALLDIAASTTARASLRLRNGTWATAPNDGEIGNDGVAMLFMLNGTNAVNTDGGLSIWMNSSVPTARNVGRLLWRYTDKTDATRKTEGAVTAFDGATEYKPVRWAANGAAMIGVLGAAPALRQVVTGSKAGGAALVSLLAALVTFGWITDNTTA